MAESGEILYSRLPADSIRLLHINVQLSEPSVGELQVVRLHEAPPYYALSHCWGPQKQTTTIEIGSERLPVCSDLLSGIMRLRELAASSSELEPPVNYVWIDNICINQEDAAERSAQVQLMGIIYSKATRTLIWLGPESSSSSKAWRFVDYIYDISKTHHAVSKLEDIPQCTYSDSYHKLYKLPEWDDKAWVQLRELFDLRWFSRIWVVQEVVQSSQDPIILHGEELRSWKHLGWVASWMRRKGYLRLPHISQAILNVDTLYILRRSRVAWPLDALISMTQLKFHATDQRDKVYSLLALSAECQDPSNIPEALKPDYTISVEQTYQKVGRFLLERSCSLALLTRIRGPWDSLTRMRRLHELPGLPWWCPDWSDFEGHNRGIRTSLSWIDYSDSSKPATLGFPQHYVASGRLKLKIHDASDPSVLRVSGFRVGKIERMVPFNEKLMSKEQFHQCFSWMIIPPLKLALSSLKKEEDITDWVAQFIKATSAEQHQLGSRTWEQSFKDGVNYLHNLLVANRHLNSSIVFRNNDGTTIDLKECLSAKGDPEVYASLARNFCYNRSFVITSNGQMGIGPSGTRVGDTVAIVPGSGVPYILRYQGSSWMLIGESYIHGLMDGEAIKSHRDGVIQEEVLEFR
jgi:hypothetical protein